MAVTDPQIPIAESTTEQPESTDADYVAWKKRTLEDAIRDDDAHPEDRRAVEDVVQDVYRAIDRTRR